MKKTLFLLLMAVVITAGCTTQPNTTIQPSSESSSQKSVSAKIEDQKEQTRSMLN